MYFFSNIHSGKYTFKIRESFKKGKGSCQSAVTISIKTWPLGQSHESLLKGSIRGSQLFQSESEMNERPRDAIGLPINLNTYKFIGAELKEGQHVAHVAFSGAIRLNERESENYIVFETKHPKSFVRFYVEKADVALTLEKLENNEHGHPSSVARGSNALAKMIDETGKYRLKIQEPSNHGKR